MHNIQRFLAAMHCPAPRYTCFRAYQRSLLVKLMQLAGAALRLISSLIKLHKCSPSSRKIYKVANSLLRHHETGAVLAIELYDRAIQSTLRVCRSHFVSLGYRRAS